MTKVVFLAAALLAAPSALPAQSLSFAVGEWPPYTGEELPLGGAAVELVTAAARAAGMTVNLEWTPWRRAEAWVAADRVFATFPYSETPGRSGKYLFSEPLFFSSFAVLVRRSPALTRDFRFSSPADFRGWKVGTTAGTDEVKVPLEQAGALVEETPTILQSVRKLEQGRLDFVVDDRAVLEAALRELPESARKGLALLETPFGDRTAFRVMASATAAGGPALLRQFNVGLARIQADGTWARILGRHGLPR